MREDFLPPTKKNLRMPENADKLRATQQQHETTYTLPTFFFLVGIVQRFET